MQQTTQLLSEPHWTRAAQALADGCSDLPDDESRVALLETVCRGLGDSLYPAFLRLLALIGRFGDFPARAAVATTLVHALRTGRLPAGRLGAWGMPETGLRDTGFAHARSLGPVEYLCVWHAQLPVDADAHGKLHTDLFDQAATSLLNLIDAAPDVRGLCGEMLLTVAKDPLEGTLNRATRQALGVMATAVTNNATAAPAIAGFFAALNDEPRAGLAVLAAQPLTPR